ncbi:MAG TPA: protein translocase subunit SecF [Tissierellaceae bacterium]|nr:protein translocase subunit SecF [Tissierellaceae bacterium]
MNVIKNRKIYSMISLIIIIIGLLMFFVKGLNYGIDFSGGTLIEINVGEFIEVDEVRKIVDEYDTGASIIHAGSEKDTIIIKSTKDLKNNETTGIINGFVEKYEIDGENFKSQKIGATISNEIKNKALLSTVVATVLMLAYITWRFQFAFGLAAIVALAHDILIMLAVYSIFRIPVNNSFIAAILAVLGYSINDTIVIFDRIRENLKLYPRETMEETINKSIKSSLMRTINTSVTTLVAVVVLYVLGVEDIKVLALPLIIGIIAGTYSSLFVASPILYELKARTNTKTAR